MAELSRKVRDADITLTTEVASANTLDMRDMAAAVVAFGTVSGASSTLQLWASNASAGTYRRLCKTDGTVADITFVPSTSEARAFYLPDEAFGVEFLKIVAASTDFDGVTGVVMFKS